MGEFRLSACFLLGQLRPTTELHNRDHMRRKVAFSLLLIASAGVTVPWAFQVSALRSLALLTLHLLLFVDVLVQPPADGVNRDDPKRVMWSKLLILALVYLPLVYSISPPTASSASVRSERA